MTDEQGRYQFRTINPVAYPGRTPHIHVKVLTRSTELTTQFYLDGHPDNPRDVLWRRMSPQQQQAVAMVFRSDAQIPIADVDIRL